MDRDWRRHRLRVGDEPPLFRLEVDDSFLEVNGNIFLRSRLTVRVYNEVSVWATS